MSTCKTIMQSLGFACFEHDNITILNTPFKSTIDGDLFQLFIEDTPNGWRITDYGLILDHAETHAVKDIDKKAKALNKRYPNFFSESGEILVKTDKESLPAGLSNAFNVMQAINGKLSAWKPKPVLEDRFQKGIAMYFESKKIIFSRNQLVTGFSGHDIRIPFVIEQPDTTNLIHCIQQKKEGIPEWSAGYQVSGQLGDIKLSDSMADRYVIVDDRGMSDQNLNSISSIATEHATILPYSRRAQWVDGFQQSLIH